MGCLARRVRKALGLPWWARDLSRFASAARATVGWETIRWRPQVLDRNAEAGTTRGVYFHQDLLVAQRIHRAKPRRHVDVGSRIDGFAAHVASFRPIEIVDIRPLAGVARNISFLQADLMQPDAVPESISDSVSCLHALEHFGLGRYGDPIDPRGHERGLDGLIRMLEPGGTLYLSVPVGRQEVLFNCHRRFHGHTIPDLAGERLSLVRLDLIDDKGNLHENIDLGRLRTDPTLGCAREGCAIYEFRRAGGKAT